MLRPSVVRSFAVQSQVVQSQVVQSRLIRSRSMRSSLLRSSLVQLAALLLIVTSAACKKTATVGSTSVNSSLVASLERGPCFGRCPVYRVELYGDGKVHFEGKQDVAVTGGRDGQTTAEAVQTFMRLVAASEFATADTAYVAGSANCGVFATDLPLSILSVKIGSQLKTIRHYPGCRNAPKFLRTLEAQLDTAARITQWIAGIGNRN